MASEELNFSHLKRRGLLTPREVKDLRSLHEEANARAGRTLGDLSEGRSLGNVEPQATNQAPA